MSKNLFILFTLFQFLSAQEPIFHQIGIEDGLPSSEVYSIVEDYQNNMWFATDRGVCRFDGKHYTTYTTKNGLEDNIIFQIHKSPYGKIWFIGSNNLLSYWNGEQILPYEHNHFLKELDFTMIYSMVEKRNGDIILGGMHQPLVQVNYEGLKYISVLKTDSIGSVYCKEIEGQYILSSKGWVRKSLKLKSEKKIEVKINGVYGEFKPVEDVGHNQLRNSGNRFFSYSTRGMMELKGNEFIYHPIPYQINYINTFENQLYLSTSGGGLIHYDPVKRKIIKQYFDGMSISQMYQDEQRNIWVSTLENGVLLLKNFHDLMLLKGQSVFSLNARTDFLNIDLYGEKSYQLLNKDEEPILKEQLHLSKQQYSAQMVLNNGYEIDDYVYLFYGIYRKVNLKTGVAFNKAFSKDVINIAKHMSPIPVNINDTLFCMYSRKGFAIIDKRNDSARSVWHLEDKVLSDVIHLGAGRMIISTLNEGLFELDLFDSQKALKPLEFKPLISSLALWGDYIIAGGSKGLFYCTTKDLKFRSLNIGGFEIKEIADLEIYKNELYVGTKRGLQIIKHFPDQYESNNSINQLKLLNNAGASVDGVLEPDANDLKILVQGSFYKTWGNTKLRYRINNSNWLVQEGMEINLNDLKSQDYTIWVQVGNNISGWSESKKLFFTINDYFYKQWYFIVIYTILVIYIAFIVVKFQVEKVKKTNKMKYDLLNYQYKNLSNQMNPHFIFNSLNSIQNYILKNDKWKVLEYISTYSSLVRRNLENSKCEAITIEDELLALKSYIELEKLRLSDKFDFEIDVKDEAIKHYLIPSMILQPIVENAIWHGIDGSEKEKNHILIQVQWALDQKYFEILIEDDGVGFDKSSNSQSIHESYGLTLTQKRLELFGAITGVENHVEIHSLRDGATGTKVKLFLKAKANELSHY